MRKSAFERGIITLSFDDGRKDTYYVFMDILKERRLPAVVYIPSGYIECGFSNPKEIGYNGMMSKGELDSICNDTLFEIGGHGYMHSNEFEDLEKGVETLRKWYPQIGNIGLASPHSEINRKYVFENMDIYKKLGFSYVRGGRNFSKFTMFKRAISLFARKSKLSFAFKWCYQNSVNKQVDYYLHAIPVHKLTTLNQVKAIVDYCAKKKYWAILEFHGIDSRESIEYEEEFCWAEDDFIVLCDYLKEMQNKGLLVVKSPLSVLRGTLNG